MGGAGGTGPTAAWPMFRRGRDHSGRAEVNGPSAPTMKWAASAAVATGASDNVVVGVDGTIYGGSGTFSSAICAWAPSGSKKWCVNTGPGVSVFQTSPALGPDGTIYGGDSLGRFFAITPEGKTLWQLQLPKNPFSSPMVGADGTIYGGGAGGVHALNPDGSIKWLFPHGTGYTVAISPGGMVYTTSGVTLYALTPAGGVLWSFEVSGVSSSPAIGADGTIYFGGGNGLNAVDPDGTFRWKFPTGGEVFSSPAIGADGTLYVGCVDKNFASLRESVGVFGLRKVPEGMKQREFHGV